MKKVFIKVVLSLFIIFLFGLSCYADDVKLQNYKYSIDEELSRCSSANFMTVGMNLCIQKGIDSWNKEIDRYLLKIKSKLSTQDIENLEKSQQAWLTYYKKKDIYLGKRLKRGLFQSSTNKLVNADINGAIGIKSGDIHTTIALDELYELTKQRALKLRGYYIELSE